MFRTVKYFLPFLCFLIGCSTSKQVVTPTPAPTIPPYIAPTSIIIKIGTPIAVQSNENNLPNNWDGGVLSEQPCVAPCFAGVIPGVTTEKDTIAIIRQDPIHFQNCQIEDLSNQYWHRDSDKSLTCYGLTMSISRKTDTITGVGFLYQSKIALSQLIEKYGEPTAVDTSSNGTPEAIMTHMIVFFEKNKIRADFGSQDGDIFQLNAASAITYIIYYSGGNGNMNSYTQPWKGYGEYKCIGCY